MLLERDGMRTGPGGQGRQSGTRQQAGVQTLTDMMVFYIKIWSKNNNNIVLQNIYVRHIAYHNLQFF